MRFGLRSVNLDGQGGQRQQASKPAEYKFHRVHTSFSERRFYWRFALVTVDYSGALRGCIGCLRAQRNRFFSQ